MERGKENKKDEVKVPAQDLIFNSRDTKHWLCTYLDSPLLNVSLSLQMRGIYCQQFPITLQSLPHQAASPCYNKMPYFKKTLSPLYPLLSYYFLHPIKGHIRIISFTAVHLHSVRQVTGCQSLITAQWGLTEHSHARQMSFPLNSFHLPESDPQLEHIKVHAYVCAFSPIEKRYFFCLRCRLWVGSILSFNTWVKPHNWPVLTKNCVCVRVGVKIPLIRWS